MCSKVCAVKFLTVFFFSGVSAMTTYLTLPHRWSLQGWTLQKYPSLLKGPTSSRPGQRKSFLQYKLIVYYKGNVVLEPEYFVAFAIVNSEPVYSVLPAILWRKITKLRLYVYVMMALLKNIKLSVINLLQSHFFVATF